MPHTCSQGHRPHTHKVFILNQVPGTSYCLPHIEPWISYIMSFYRYCRPCCLHPVLYLLYGLLHDRYLLEKFRTLINCFDCLHLNLVQITCARKGNRKRAYHLLIYIRLLIILNLKWISIQSSLLRYEILKMVDFSKLFGIIFQSVCKKSIINIMIWSRIFEVCVIDGMRVRWYLFLWWGLYL